MATGQDSAELITAALPSLQDAHRGLHPMFPQVFPCGYASQSLQEGSRSLLRLEQLCEGWISSCNIDREGI